MSVNGGLDWTNEVYFHYNASNTMIILVIGAAVILVLSLVLGALIRFHLKSGKKKSLRTEYVGINTEEPKLGDSSSTENNSKGRKKVTFLLDSTAKICRICYEKAESLVDFGKISINHSHLDCCQSVFCASCVSTLQYCPFCNAKIHRMAPEVTVI